MAVDRKGTFKVEYLQSIEREVQAKWEKEKIFEIDAPNAPRKSIDDKFLVTFPYPYMNGKIHLGHTFSLSKAEFAVRYQRLKGKQCLFPLGFHCTGMPIKACADKLKRELEYGYPPVFPNESETVVVDKEDVVPKDKSKGKKSKAVAKQGATKYQWEIMRSLGLNDEEIIKFTETDHWLEYFPPLAVSDLKKIGVHVDWRRTFITTDANPFYDSFIRWQFGILKARGKIMYGKRYTIYSPKDGQPCMDHDRSTGEGVGPLEYTLIKMKLIDRIPAKLAKIKEPIFMLCATLRPETMYGQTNCWVHPDVTYILIKGLRNEYWLCTKRSALNIAYQFEEVKGDCVLEISGSELIGAAVSSPLTSHEKMYVLPMLSIKEDKGTGIVVSVPSDSCDDYAALIDLQKNAVLRSRYNIADDAIFPFKPIPIINVPGLGDLSAVTVYDQFKIQSQNDRDKLLEAKELLYLKGYYDGVMIVGKFAGQKVQDIRKNVKTMLIEDGSAENYYEPEKTIMSRSGDVCVVALCNQWYLNYGEEQWRGEATKNLNSMETYHDEVRKNFEVCLDWLHEYACTRTYGLGTKLPWDEEWLIESLSDSTIYMAFYTISHLLLGGSFKGEKPSPLNIKPEQMTDDVWNYIFVNGSQPKTTAIKLEHLQLLKKEFEYWYPVDLRVSGKDLIQNHLTFFLYNHCAIWPQDDKKWPRGIRCNGHLLLNSAKMSKSDGNFLTLTESVDKFSADGTRLCLADSGDGIEDANFVESSADAGILRLYTFIEWVKEMITNKSTLRTGPANTFYDKVFLSEMNLKTQQTDESYKKLLFKEGLRVGFFEFQAARDKYRELCVTIGMHVDLVFEYIKRQSLILSPICPHVCEHVWSLLGNKKSLLYESWPCTGNISEEDIKRSEYLMEAARSFRLSLKQRNQIKIHKVQKTGLTQQQQQTPQRLIGIIWVAKMFPPWQSCVLDTMRELYEKHSGLPDNKILSTELNGKPILKKYMKRIMPFAQMIRERVETIGKEAMAVTLDFNERSVLEENLDYLKNTLNLDSIEIRFTDEPTASVKTREEVCPGDPYIEFMVNAISIALDNPQQGSGYFTINTSVSPGDTITMLKEKISKMIGLKDIKTLNVWRHEDPIAGPRKIPILKEWQKEKVLILDNEILNIDLVKNQINLMINHGKCIENIGTDFIYVIDE